MNYKQTAAEILKNVGGKENISHFEHCSTRLRFSLVDSKKADVKKLESTEGVMAVKMTGQCQVVIGNDVIEVYDEIMKLIGNADLSSQASDKPKEKQKLGALVLDFMVGIFQPLVPAIAGGGVLKSLLLLLSVAGIMATGSSTYKILSYIGDAPLYFLPIMVAITTANKLKVNSLVAMSAVAALILPNMTALLKEGTQLFGFGVQNIAYAYQVFPAILTVLLYAQLEKFFTKVSPKSVRIFLVPMMSLLVTVPAALLLLGPAGFNFGQGFAAVILAIFAKMGWIAVGLLAAVLPFMVATGMHKAMLPYAISTFTQLGKEILYLPASLAHNIAESGACFGVAIRTRDKNLRSIAISAGISALFGITEPALYGVTLQNKKVLASVVIGSFVGGSYVGLVGLHAFAIVGPGLASISMFISETAPNNIVNAIIGLAISFIVAFAAALVLGKDNSAEKAKEVLAVSIGSEETFRSPLNGTVISLSEVKDDVFSSRAMGDGIAVVPSEGKLYAPVAGKIEMVFETNHALGMTTNNGAQILFHVGLDTVKLGGKHFEPKVKVGDLVKAGDLLLEFDLEKIVAEGFDPVTVVVVTNKDEYEVKVREVSSVKYTDNLMTVTELAN
ncbi:beta-glucoside-specific PTS transporter subunit IIABC [Youngiibacter fragilis]|uniref:PTS beta-glucoside transporter subunit IIABC n=1 Tax=Youngiibacter fragilis 232.1 TaxID=994573 RepID=V7I726_9CLOT|nr:beta-glucoside-specific PTS transporter subunit IIABC [Youngiibacter fragilis]ETA81024.1 PTS beta-glucoside transporter subunit IIABC [Youngiibacter fragilis 232.1]